LKPYGVSSLLVEGALCGAEFVQIVDLLHGRRSFWLELTAKAIHQAQMDIEIRFLLLGDIT
jgi:hypothetical protein